jgi:hypothetical protein
VNTIICAGGSGFKVLESVIHLCAAGLGPRTLRVLGIDPDGTNGNGGRTRRLIDHYQECRKILGPTRMGEDLNWFGTELDLLDPKGKDAVAVWSPVKSGQNLRQILNYDALETTATPPDVVRLLFTNTELNEKLDQGFRGHPAIGAALMSLASTQANRQPWVQVIERIRGELDEPAGARVFIAGSVFGGTGASSIHPIARFLRESVKDVANPGRLKIAVAALVPFFRFSANAGTDSGNGQPEMFARSELFSLATRSSVEFYDSLRRNRDWPFDAVYWIGDNSRVDVGFAPGSEKQENPAHFVELLAAITALEFFKEPVTEGACYYSGPRQDVTPPENMNENLLDWEDLPLRVFDRQVLKKQLVSFFMSGAAHLGFFAEMLQRPDLDRRAYCVPWYYERFKKADQSLMEHDRTKELELLSKFFGQYAFEWWSQMIQGKATNVRSEQASNVRLFNDKAFIPGQQGQRAADLKKLRNFVYPDRPGDANMEHFDRFFSDMVRVPQEKGGARGVAAYFSLLAHASMAFFEREYKVTLKGKEAAQ